VEGQESASGEGKTETVVMELEPAPKGPSPWSIRPGLLWGRGLWESAGHLTFMEWNLMVLGAAFSALTVLGAISLKWPPLHPFFLAAGLVGLGAVSLASQWTVLVGWN